MRIRLAETSDVPLIVCWRNERAAWLRARGSDQWNDAGLTTSVFKSRVLRSITAGETWMAVDDDGSPLGTIAVDSEPDPGLWTDDELTDALVIHRMIVGQTAAGRGIGAALLEHANKLARACGKRRLVLDAWTSNQELHAYYKSNGFGYVRTVENHSTPSAALFERPI